MSVVRWYWRSDKDWVAFDDAMNTKAETEYKKGNKSIQIDKERYIDLGLTWDQIVKNFTNINDKTLVGIQRRYDDPMKRRAVKRGKIGDTWNEIITHVLVEVQTIAIFKDDVFVFGGCNTRKLKKKEEELKNTIETYGASLAAKVDKKKKVLQIFDISAVWESHYSCDRVVDVQLT